MYHLKMIVRKTNRSSTKGIPNYYELYLKWWEFATQTGDYRAIIEAKRLARLAEEFGQAIIEEDDTLSDF
jgi:hypothetical protein